MAPKAANMAPPKKNTAIMGSMAISMVSQLNRADQKAMLLASSNKSFLIKSCARKDSIKAASAIAMEKNPPAQEKITATNASVKCVLMQFLPSRVQRQSSRWAGSFLQVWQIFSSCVIIPPCRRVRAQRAYLAKRPHYYIKYTF